MKKSIFTLIIAAGALVLAALPAVAQSPQSDQIHVIGDGFNLSITATEANEAQNANTLYTDSSLPGNPSAFGNPTFLTEPGSGTIDDIFGVANVGTAANPVYQLAFMSGNDFTSPDLTVAQGFFGPSSGWINGGAETANTYDMARYENCAPNCSGTFQSDLGDQTTVPDGGMTVTLLGTALAGIGLLRRKLRAV